MIISNVDFLSKTSRKIVEVSCDICNNTSKLTYYSYNRNIKRGGFFSCKKCSSVKRKKTMLEKYGVENSMHSDEIKNKIKQTNLEKWGVENPFQLEEVKEKIKRTNLEKWGVECSLNSEEVKNKIKQTNLKKYGNEHHMRSDEIKNKVKQTNLQRWGVESYSKTEEYHVRTNIGKDIDYIKYINNSISLFKCNKGHNFQINIDNYIGRKRSNLPLCTICNPIGDSQSIKEKELFEFISSIYNRKIIQSYRDGLEIDIYLPDLKLGFEFNGLYWHSELFKEKNYHLDKNNHFKEKGIRIIHIWEDDWVYKRNIIESQIKNWLGLTETKIFARKCYVKEIKDSKISTKFLEENHIQGKVGSSLKLGLYHDNVLVSLMTFNRYEGRIKMEAGGWNINRFCNKINYSVVGGASKLFNYFIKNYEINRVISYSDSDWSLGNLYETLGFEKINEGNPDYKYIIDGKRVHKSRFRKDKLNLINKNETTESFFMKKNNIYRIYGCGKVKFEKIYEKH